MRVLVSFLGTGKLEKDKQDIYRKTTYVFPDGEKITTILATAPLIKKLKPSKVLFIGTPKSIWPALEELLAFEGKSISDKSIYTRVFEETLSDKGISEEALKEWANLLNETLSYEISLRTVKDEDDLQSIVLHMYNEVPENTEEIYLEITHAFRHFPLIASFTVPILRILKNAGRLNFVYGLFGGGVSKIIFVEELNRLVELLEALSLSEYGGNFSRFSEVFNDKELKELYIKTETNRRISTSLINELFKGLPEDNIYRKIAKEYLEQRVLNSLKGDRLPLRMANRAVFFADKEQFLKAYTLIYEAIVGCFLNMNEFESATPNKRKLLYDNAKAKLKEFLKDKEEYMNVWRTIEAIRHSIAHGSKPYGIDEDLLTDTEALKYYVYKGKEIVERILNTES